MNNPVPSSDPSASKYRRVAPKQGAEGNSFTDGPQASPSAEGFARSALNSQAAYGASNFRPTLPSPTPTFPMSQGQTRENTSSSLFSNVNPPPASAPAPAQPIKFETALEFLDQVKQQFEDNPRVYKQFLKIMKDFKLHEIDTPGVIRRVSELFRGHDHLILGFNRFLPEGYKITHADTQHNQLRYQVPGEKGNFPLSGHERDAAHSNAFHTHTLSMAPPSASVSGATPNAASSAPSTLEIEASGIVPAVTNRVPNKSSSPLPAPALLDSQPKSEKQPELEHARNYVKKIKVRFEAQPDVYKQFLRILHTFHEEHNTISNVYEQVAVLFKNHSDLLREFKQFLPDTTQSEPRPQRTRPKTRKRKAEELEISPQSVNDYNFFDSARAQLRTEPPLYEEFIKVLRLYNEEIISQYDLLTTVRALFSAYPELYTEFLQFCEWEDVPLPASPSPDSPSPVELSPAIERNVLDLSQCERADVSYCVLPAEFVHPVCSGRTDLCHEVLNDTYVSAPPPSESVKMPRKNEYEENLVLCEELRYEMDIAIAINSSTIAALQKIAKEIEATEPNKLRAFKPTGGLDGIHLSAIQRVYGQKGELILQGLEENPVVSVPIVMRRLLQKDAEWRASRTKWTPVWQEMNERNYLCALDHQSSTFKLKDRKLLNPRELLAEIKNDNFSRTMAPGRLKDSSAKVLSLSMEQPSVLSHIAELIQWQAQITCHSDSECEKLVQFVHTLIGQFFRPAGETGLFFGNNSFYVLFRFYHILYERLLEAKDMSEKALVSLPPPADAPTGEGEARPRLQSAEEIYRYYLEELLHPLIDGTLESSRYEALCREIFGIHSYVLFTMDRLLRVLVKQILSIFLEETSSELYQLHGHELTRSKELIESIYHASALKITAEERCFKFTFSDGKFSIEMLDAAQKPTIVDYDTPRTNLSTPRDHHRDMPSISSLSNTPSYTPSESPLDNQKHNVFLLRNQRQIPEALVAEGVTVVNGLECKICSNTFRHFYVEETEDFFYRSGRLSKARSYRCAKKIQKLHNWVQSRLGIE